MVLQFTGLASRFNMSWLDLCNRHESLTIDNFTGARTCGWEDSSELTVSRVFPSVGKRLLSHCLEQWPIELNFNPDRVISNKPAVSVIIAVGGKARMPQFQLTLASLRGQRHAAFEIIVVEQSPRACFEHLIPEDVRYLHTSLPGNDAQFNKSWALNCGVRLAVSDLLMIHDADYVVPAAYISASEKLAKASNGVRPSRFIFYLNEPSTRNLIEEQKFTAPFQPESIVQNNPTPLIVPRQLYWEIGGHDEAYFGWGGEDNEFLSRLRLHDVAEGGILPVIHLWHPPAKKRADGDRNRKLHDAINRIDIHERIKLLRNARQGSASPQVVTVKPDKNGVPAA